jgi:hypothetical protein
VWAGSGLNCLRMDLLALPLPWFELLATTALTPAEIGRLRSVCRLLWQTLGADDVWRELCADLFQSTLVPGTSFCHPRSTVVFNRMVCASVAQAHFATSMDFGSSLPPVPVGSGHGVAYGGHINASSVASRVRLHYEQLPQMDGESFQRTLCQCGCANAATRLCTQCEHTASERSSDCHGCGQAED